MGRGMSFNFWGTFLFVAGSGVAVLTQIIRNVRAWRKTCRKVLVPTSLSAGSSTVTADGRLLPVSLFSVHPERILAKFWSMSMRPRRPQRTVGTMCTDSVTRSSGQSRRGRMGEVDETVSERDRRVS